jgi:glycosyltransferase involved in cell wall biosynthesis
MAKILVTRPAANDPGGVTVLYDNIAEHFADNGIDIEFLEIGSTRGRFLHPFSDQLAFRKKIKDHRFDLILINPSLGSRSFFRDGLLAWQAKARGLPLLVFIHGWSDNFAREVERRWMRFFAHTFGRADAFIVLASDFEEKLRKWGVRVPIYRGTTAVSDSLIADIDIEEKLKSLQNIDEFQLLFLARLERAKGVIETIDACALLLERGRHVNLVVAGDGPEAAEIKSYANDKLGDHVQFPGYVRDKAKSSAFAVAHIYVMPSYGEGLPISLLEAMSFGLPVVTRPVGGVKDMFVNGQHGFMTESKNPAEIAALIEKLLDDPQLLQNISRNVHKYAMDRFIGSAVAANFAKIMIEVSHAAGDSNAEPNG